MDEFKCFLVCQRGTHDPIELPHLQAVVIGRSPLTRIEDSQVSRSQLSLTADCTLQEVTVKQLAARQSFANGHVLNKGETSVLHAGDLLCLIADKYQHRIDFIKTDPTGSKSIVSDASSGSVSPRWKRKSETVNDLLSKEPKVSTSSSSDKSACENVQVSDGEHIEEVKARLELLRKTVDDENKEELGESSKHKKTPTKLEKAPGKSSPAGPATSASWMQKDTLLVYTSQGLTSRAKVAGFDIDGTIIGTKSGKVFATHTGDWQILLPEIPGHLHELHNDGYKIVFFSNQMGIEKNKVNIGDFKTKVENIISKLNIPVHAVISTGKGPYRKPGLGMWNWLLESGNDGVAVKKEESFFVGDAAGRPKDWLPGKKKDFSCGDRLFALNAGLQFFTPEEFFQKKSKAKFVMPVFDPRSLAATAPLFVLTPQTAKLTLGEQEVIILVGSPAAGKSHFVTKYLLPKGYVHVNRDTLGTWQKCVQATREAVAKGSSVAVDNTSPDLESRLRYLDVAQTAGVACRCFVMSTTMEHAKHNERFREMTDKKHDPISEMVFNMYKSKFVQPTVSEGFREIVGVNFIPDFHNVKHETLYKQFLVEK